MAVAANKVLLVQAKQWLVSRLDDGAMCPCCKQHAKIYKRRINSGMARSLIAMYRAGGTDYVHVPTQVGSRSREEGKLRYWGLVEEELVTRPDGGRAGYWRLTPAGEMFVKGMRTVPMYARVYNGRCLGLTGTQVSIKDALGTKFDYNQLMRA